MAKFRQLHLWFQLFLVSFCFMNVGANCIFDDVKLTKPVKQFSRYSLKSIDSDSILHKNNPKLRIKRTPDENFQPIRIYVEYHQDDTTSTALGELEWQNLKKAMDQAVYKAEKIFSVIRVEGVLMLARSNDACVTSYLNGTNKGKCASVRRHYQGETCIDNFMIPEEHLEGLYVYGASDPEPREVIRRQGNGVADTDYILYVRSSITNKCVDRNSNVKAYATYCQLSETNRPIAGYINFCPSILSDENYNEHSLYMTALHELFHALGFSKDMFGKFRECGESGCNIRQADDTTSVIDGIHRLVTPLAIEFTTRHFNCITNASINEFGPILHTTEAGILSSHWDGAFMYSSIMTPTIGQPHETVIDNITLAFFEDTGWYRVNYSHAQNFPWGRDGGCTWGTYPECTTKQVGDCFCAVVEEQGCHYLLKSKGVCKTDKYLDQCYTYKSQRKDNCLRSENSPNDTVLQRTGEIYSRNSRCFLANVSTTQGDHGMVGRCYSTRCNGSNVDIQVGTSPWAPCPYGQIIQVEGYAGVLRCPEAGILCVDNVNEKPYKWPPGDTNTTTTALLTPTTTTDRPTYASEDETNIIVVEIYFTSANYGYLQRTDQIGYFMEQCVVGIMHATDSSRRRIQNLSLRSGSVIFQFDLHPAQYNGDGPPSRVVISRLSQLINQNRFTVYLSQNGDTVAASRLITMETPSRSDDGTPTEVIVGVVIGSIIAAMLIGIAVFFVQRFYAAQTQRSAHRNAYRQSQQRSVTTETDSRNSSQSRASARSRYSMRSRHSNNTVSMMLGAGVDLDSEAVNQQQHDISTPESTSAIDGVVAAEYVVPISRTPDISYDHRSDRTPDSSRSSKPSSRQRTPVSADRKSRRSSYAQSSNSRASSGDRQASSTGSSHGRRRSRSRSRSSLKLTENSVFTPNRNKPTRRSQSTRSSEKPCVQKRKASAGNSNKSFENDAGDCVYLSPRSARRAKYKGAVRTNSQSGNKPNLRPPRPREQRRKTTQCVFSPRELVNTPIRNLSAGSDIDVSCPVEKSINVDGSKPARYEIQEEDAQCPLNYTNNRKYDTTACPLQTPNCSKEDIKECDLPPPVINPRDSDLSFTVDLRDIDLRDSLSVFSAPRHDYKSDGSHTPPTPTPSTPPLAPPAPQVRIHVPTNGYHVERSVFHPTVIQPLCNGSVVQHYNHNSVAEHFRASPVVEHLEQLPLMVPIFKLSARDVEAFQRASGSWRSFSSDTSLDSMSSPV